MLLGYAILELQDRYIVVYIHPVGVWCHAKQPGSVCCILQVGPCSGISKCIIIYVLCPFVGGYHILYIIMPRTITLYAACPKVCSSFQQRIPPFAKPIFVLSHTVIIP